MSAFILSDKHFFTIAAFVAGRIQGHGLDRHQLAQNLADKLKRVNIESVNFRYDEKTPRTKCKVYTTAKDCSPAEVYRLCRCWIYQACEDQTSADFFALQYMLEAQFTQDEKRQSDNVQLWTI